MIEGWKSLSIHIHKYLKIENIVTGSTDVIWRVSYIALGYVNLKFSYGYFEYIELTEKI